MIDKGWILNLYYLKKRSRSSDNLVNGSERHAQHGRSGNAPSNCISPCGILILVDFQRRIGRQSVDYDELQKEHRGYSVLQCGSTCIFFSKREASFNMKASVQMTKYPLSYKDI